MTFRLLALTLFAPAVWACTCSPQMPPCASVWGADAVFSGVVESIDDQDIGRPVVAHFRIEKAYRGLAAGKQLVDVQTGHGGGDCGVFFQTGARYLVYGSSDTRGFFKTTICSRTKLLKLAAEDLEFLNTFTRGGETGELQILAWNVQKGFQPVPGVSVTVQGSKGSKEVKTNADGFAVFPNLRAGEYKVSANAPGMAKTEDQTTTLQVPGCRVLFFPLKQ